MTTGVMACTPKFWQWASCRRNLSSCCFCWEDGNARVWSAIVRFVVAALMDQLDQKTADLQPLFAVQRLRRGEHLLPQKGRRAVEAHRRAPAKVSLFRRAAGRGRHARGCANPWPSAWWPMRRWGSRARSWKWSMRDNDCLSARRRALRGGGPAAQTDALRLPVRSAAGA